MTQRLYHMVPVEVWDACLTSRKPYFPETYEQDGFIHLTADPSLLLTVANHFYTASQGDWVVLVLDSGKLTAEVKLEPAAPVGSKSSQGLLGGLAQQQQQQQQQGPPQQHEQQDGEQAAAGAAAAAQAGGPAAAAPEPPLFPHLYGSIDFDAVVCQLAMQRSEDGRFTAIQGLPPADCPYSEFT